MGLAKSAGFPDWKWNMRHRHCSTQNQEHLYLSDFKTVTSYRMLDARIRKAGGWQDQAGTTGEESTVGG